MIGVCDDGCGRSRDNCTFTTGCEDDVMRESQIAGLLTPILAQHGLDLDAVEVVPAGKRRLLRIVVDGDGPTGTGPLLDDIAEATKACSVALDDSEVVGSSPYTLEVSSRGVSRPLELPRHWRRNLGRLVAVTTTTEGSFTGRVVSTTDDAVTLDVEGAHRTVNLAEVTKAQVQVELNRPRTTEPDGSDTDEDDQDLLDEDDDTEEEDH
jgi:ribosome maturation factor RimP